MTADETFLIRPHRANFLRFQAISARGFPVSMEEAPGP